MQRQRVDQRRVRGDRTRAEILEVAADIASREGLERLSLGVLADALEMSKSGVVRHFGSRENLQLATIERAAEVFAAHVLGPVHDLPPGLPRLRSLVSAWVDYLVSDAFSGGCFFYAASAELDRRPGPLRDAVFATVRAGLRLIRSDLEAAVSDGDLTVGADVDQLLFELHALVQEVSTAHLMLDDPRAAERGTRAVQGLLQRHGAARVELDPSHDGVE